ncbi:Crp/Fnr family transcriptional regulator [Lactobacillus sp. YT155]|uniref:Crp/Fnr family transcriptional regulator n=1 Tax=Lactobacillus sp. YT155 TaxID=3060955 RepID=UPI00265DDFF9|nr:Crp/Fnr family transcriptional regulator [Lactobacillus sp. YT155]MDO1604795.1 Crp/Fnr family transcriptional regulator [Lactobacillus sp. YT155]
MEQHICAEIVPIFQRLSRNDLLKISAITRHKEIAKNEMVFAPNSQDELVILAAGSIKIYQLNKNGKEQLLRIMQPGDFEGERVLYGINNKNLYATALKNSTICTLPKSSFQKLLIDYPEISQHLLTDFAFKLEKLERQVELFNSESVEAKLATYILDLSVDQNSQVVELPFKLKELARYIGTTPETLSRKFKDLENKKVINRNQLKIHILDNDELENIF